MPPPAVTHLRDLRNSSLTSEGCRHLTGSTVTTLQRYTTGNVTNKICACYNKFCYFQLIIIMFYLCSREVLRFDENFGTMLMLFLKGA